MARRRRRGKRSGFGRLVEGLAVLVLVLVVLTFGFSIANRFSRGEGELLQGIALEAAPPPDPIPAQAGLSFDVADDRVELVIENGCGVNGLAKWVADEIRGPRFDVVDYRDADRYDHLETTILTTERGRQAAQELLRELLERYGVGQVQLTTETIYGADVRLILGADLADIWKRRSDVP